ncbi:MAG: ferrous iron transport protein A [Akkermansia sp.]|nr:ferrous iron transport protein A [Akkermansia sp.]
MNHTLTLNQVKVGRAVRVSCVKGGGPLRQRILDMGLTAGAEVTVRRMAPLGDPLEVRVRGYELSLRKAEAACIEVQ